MQMHVELAQLRCKDGDKAHNVSCAVNAIRQCADSSQMLVLPELFLTGFPTMTNVASLAERIDGPSIASIQVAARVKNVSVVVGFVESDANRYYNTTVLVTPDGKTALRYRKTHLFFGERDVFTPGDRLSTTLWQGIRIGLLICYDIEFPETSRVLAQLGADVFIVTNGNMDPYGPVHRSCIVARALENQAFAVMSNRVGAGEGQYVFAGGSAAVDPFGVILKEAGRYEETIQVQLNLARLQSARTTYIYSEDQRLRMPGEIRVDGDIRHFLIPTEVTDNPSPTRAT